MTLKARLVAAQTTALTIVQVWWRPMICAEFAVTVGVNMIYLPLKTGHSIEFLSAAAFVSAIVAGFAVRTYEKINT